MGAGVYDIVLGLDEAALDAALAAASSIWARSGNSAPTYTTQDSSGDSWTFAVPLGAPTVSLTGASNGMAQLQLTLVQQITASNATNPAQSFVTSVPVQCSCSLMLASDPAVLTLEAHWAQVSTGDPSQAQLLNQLLMLWVQSYLNSVMPTFALPALEFEGVTLAAPNLGVDSTTAGNNVLLIFTGINPVVVPDSGTGTWPAASMFLAVDAALPNAMIPPIPVVSGSNQHGSISYDYQAQPQVGLMIQPGAGNAVTANVTANGPFGLEWHTPSGFPNVSFNGNYSGTCAMTADVLINVEGGFPQSLDMNVKIAALSDVDFSVTVDSISLPAGLDIPVPPVPTDSISAEIGSEVSSAATGMSFYVGSMRSSASVGSGLALGFANPAVMQFAAPGGVPLLAVTATASWSQ
jgi:hypothetical protein